MKPAVAIASRIPTQRRRVETIRVARRYDASASRVFGAWLDPAVARRWLFATASRPLWHVDIDPKVGGRFALVDRRGREVTRYGGQYVEIVADRRLAFTLRVDHCAEGHTRARSEIGSGRDAPNPYEHVRIAAGRPTTRPSYCADDDAGTRVSVDVVATAVGCELTVTHENVPADDAEHVEGRWTGILYGLGVTLDCALALQHD